VVASVAKSMRLWSAVALSRPALAASRVGGAGRGSIPWRHRRGPCLQPDTGGLVPRARWSRAVNAEHLPGRPSWDCLACGRPWPCDPAREALAVEFLGHRLGLAVYLGAQFAGAAEDLDAMARFEPADLYDRILSWLNPAVRTGGWTA
jgi:hypothetical protein